MKPKLNIKLLAISFLIVIAVAGIGGIFNIGETDSDWYESIRPSITPPNWVFPIAWNIIFFLIAISIYTSYSNANKSQKPTLIKLFAINLTLNILWSLFYFKLHNPLIAFIDIILIWASILALIIYNYKISKISSYTLIPYFLWVSFASILNFLSI